MRSGLKELAFVTALLSAGVAWAHDGASGVVRERMDAMSAIGKNMKPIGRMLKGGAPYDPASVAKAAKAIAQHGGEAFTALFPDDSLQSPTEAAPAIWTDWQTFSGYADDLRSSAAALETLARDGADKQAVAGAFGTLAGTCKSCHEAFRIKK